MRWILEKLETREHVSKYDIYITDIIIGTHSNRFRFMLHRGEEYIRKAKIGKNKHALRHQIYFEHCFIDDRHILIYTLPTSIDQNE